MIREAVTHFASLGPLDGVKLTDEKIDQLEKSLEKIIVPISNEEANILLASFGTDDCFGLAWSLIHIIETADKCPVKIKPIGESNEWVHLLWQRSMMVQK